MYKKKIIENDWNVLTLNFLKFWYNYYNCFMKAHELVRKAKDNVRLGNIQEAANLYSDAAGKITKIFTK